MLLCYVSNMRTTQPEPPTVGSLFSFVLPPLVVLAYDGLFIFILRFSRVCGQCTTDDRRRGIDRDVENAVFRLRARCAHHPSTIVVCIIIMPARRRGVGTTTYYYVLRFLLLAGAPPPAPRLITHTTTAMATAMATTTADRDDDSGFDAR